jgi:hypothetical protein
MTQIMHRYICNYTLLHYNFQNIILQVFATIRCQLDVHSKSYAILYEEHKDCNALLTEIS